MSVFRLTLFSLLWLVGGVLIAGTSWLEDLIFLHADFLWGPCGQPYDTDGNPIEGFGQCFEERWPIHGEPIVVYLTLTALFLWSALLGILAKFAKSEPQLMFAFQFSLVGSLLLVIGLSKPTNWLWMVVAVAGSLAGAKLSQRANRGEQQTSEV